MKKIFLALTIILLFSSCSTNNDTNQKIYDITYTVTATNGTTINKVEYLDSNANLIEVTNVSSPWTINLKIRAGLGLQAAAYGDIPHQGTLSISANWKPQGGQEESESETLPNSTPNSIINNGKVEISGRTLPH